MYPPVPAQPSFPQIEDAVLARWASDDTFQASIDRRDGAPEYVFYDGPPFANGLPHYGHLLTSYVKDIVPRYRTMRGAQVHRRFGWDCHGLPAEHEAERQLGIQGLADITAYGIARFNEFCRASVLEYTNEWERYVTRAARWVDFEDDYKTLDLPYMESVMWAFKALWDKGLVYEGFRVLPYSWALETPLSNTETRMDDTYKQVQDPALTVRFRLSNGDDIVAWTTTPWTLPSNLALAVGPELTYAVVREPSGQRVVMAASRVAAYAKELAADGAEPEVVATMPGSDLVGLTYTPMFPFFADHPNSFRVLAGDFVADGDGTGVVHLAPGFGEDDQRLCEASGITLVVPVDSRGRFTSEVPDYEGLLVFDANPKVIAHLKERQVVLRHETYDHSYPHCWRTGTKLIYKAVSSWFVQVTAFRDRMVELNQEITWIPEHIRDGQFGKWLEGARDWTISRNRFWGSPIPVWKSDDPSYPRVDVYGSLDEIERDFGVRPDDLHRPFVDDLVRPNPDDPTGRSTMRRVPEVLDCWFESGSMPFAQVHYPFENREWFESHYPGDFIVEYIGQTRGWFYTLHVLATALFDRPAFRTCVSHGIVLGDDGQKMSKSLRNYPDVYAMFDAYGSDAMRWFLMSSPILRGTDLIVTEAGIRDSVRQVILPLWNSWSFLSLYANAESTVGRWRTDSPHVLDRYVLAKTSALVDGVTVAMDAADLFTACEQVRVFLDALTNWYIRRSRDRFWSGDQDAVDTLHTVLDTVCRLAAPLLPLIVDEVYRGLVPESPSVHLTDWPAREALPHDDALVAAMDRVREVCSAASSLRKAKGLRVRLPLQSLTVAAADADTLAPFTSIIAEEVNVREVRLTTNVSSLATEVLTVVPAVLGPRIGGHVQHVIKAVKTGAWERTADGAITAAGIKLEEGEYTTRLTPADPERSVCLPDAVVSLDTAVTDELEAEGTARDVIRLVQQARRDAGLHISDRISLTIEAEARVTEAVERHRDLVAGEVLALSLQTRHGLTAEATPDSRGVVVSLDDQPVRIVVERVAPGA
jgi:isoleucyl-tRNA synthetase